jgi:hypothetical protein
MDKRIGLLANGRRFGSPFTSSKAQKPFWWRQACCSPDDGAPAMLRRVIGNSESASMSLNPGTAQPCFLAAEGGHFLDVAPNIRFWHALRAKYGAI